MDSDNSVDQRYLEEGPIVMRWEHWSNQGMTDEVFADAADVFGSHLSDSEYINRLFHAAIEHGAYGLASRMLEMGAETNAVNSEGGFTPLYTAIVSPNPSVGMIKWLLEKGADPDGQITQGARPLHLAVRRNNRKAIVSLVENGADINATDLDHGYTPLELAASLGRVQLVKSLVDLGADVRPSRLEDIAAKRDRNQILEIVRKKEKG